MADAPGERALVDGRSPILIRFRVLGGIELHDPRGRPLQSVLAQPKRLALLAWLSFASPAGFHRRDRLLGLFWPELDENRARGALNQAVYHLRRSLGHDVIISRGREELGVNPARIWCDANAFERALDDGRADEALRLYRGDLLTSFFIPDALEWEQWLEQERARLRSRAAIGAWTLAEAAAARGSAAETGWWGRRSVALSPGDEPRLRQVITLLAGVGDRIGALRAYEDAVAGWRRDGDMEPSAETREVIERVRARGAAVVDSGIAVAIPSGSNVPVTREPHPAFGAGGPGAGGHPTSNRELASTASAQLPSSNASASPAAARERPSRMSTAPAVALVALLAAVLLLPVLLRAPPPRFDARSAAARQAGGGGAGPSEAFAEYERGRHFLAKLDAASFAAARQHFERSLDLEPAFAEAWSGLSQAFIQLTSLMVLPPGEGYPRARAAAERALARDSTIAEAHAALAMALSMYYWDTPAAERHFRRAIRLDPGSAPARRMYAAHLRNLGRFDEALDQIRRAQALDPFFAFARVEEAITLHVSGRNDEALRRLREYLQVEPGDTHAYVFVAMAHEQLGQYQDALAALDITDPAANRPDAQSVRGTIYARMGDHQKARSVLATLERLARNGRPVSPFHHAAIHVALGEHERALDLLEQAAEQPAMQMRLLKVRPTWDALRTYPRFDSLLTRVGLLPSSP